MISEAARRYAEGLFELAKETGTVSEKKEQAESLQSVLDESDDLLLFLRAVRISREEKISFIDQTFGKIFDHDMCSFLKLLIDKDRTYYLKEIIEQFTALCNEELGIERAEVFSARPLGTEDLEKIRTALEKRRGRKIILENRIDPRLIAGIRVKTGSTVTDLSVEKQIEDMKQTILKGGRV